MVEVQRHAIMERGIYYLQIILYAQVVFKCLTAVVVLERSIFARISDFHLPNINESQFLDYAGNEPVSGAN